MRTPLSDRQREIAGLLAQGLTQKEIAAEIGVSHQTVKNHLTVIYLKCSFAGHGAGSNLRLVALVASGDLDRTDNPIAA